MQAIAVHLYLLSRSKSFKADTVESWEMENIDSVDSRLPHWPIPSNYSREKHAFFIGTLENSITSK